MMSDDLKLLADYARHGTEQAFETLVRRHADLVYSAALRLVRSPHTAEEVAQAVFIELAHSAKRMKPDTILPAWLHRVTRSKAIDVLRRDSSRQRREQQVTVLDTIHLEPAPVSEIEPMLDDALDALTDIDRAAVMLRFLEEKSLTDVGNALGISADAAQKRVSRAVDQLRGFFTKRGIAVGTAGVAAVLSANTVKAPPGGLAGGICSAVKTATLATATPTSAATLIKSIAMTTSQQALVAAAAIAVGISGGYYAGGNQDAPASVAHVSPAPSSSSRPPHTRSGDMSSRFRSASIASRKPGRVDRTQALMDFYAGLNSTQLAAEARKLDKLPPSEILIASFLLYSRWGEIDPTAALNGAGKRQFLIPTILRSWASVDAKAAGEYCRTHGDASDVATELAWQDPDAALAWAKTLKPDDRFAEVCVLRELAKTDPARAWSLAAETDATRHYRAYEEIASQWALKDFATAERHIGALPDDIRNMALSAAVQALAKTDPKLAATHLSDISGFSERGRADDAVKESMARLFPGETAAIPPLKPGDQLPENETPEGEGMGEDEHTAPLLTDPNFGKWFLDNNF